MKKRTTNQLSLLDTLAPTLPPVVPTPAPVALAPGSPRYQRTGGYIAHSFDVLLSPEDARVFMDYFYAEYVRMWAYNDAKYGRSSLHDGAIICAVKVGELTHLRYEQRGGALPFAAEAIWRSYQSWLAMAPYLLQLRERRQRAGWPNEAGEEVISV